MTRALVTSAQAASSPAMRVRAGLPAPGLSALGVAVDPLPLFSDASTGSSNTPRAASRSPLVRTESQTGTRRRLARPASGCCLDPAAGGHASFAERRARDSGGSTTGLRRRRRNLVSGTRGWRASPGVSKASKRKARWLATRADQVIAGNEILAEWLSSVAQNVTVVPSVVDMDDLPLCEHSDRGTLVIGWIGSPTTAAYLGGAVPAIEEASRAMPR